MGYHSNWPRVQEANGGQSPRQRKGARQGERKMDGRPAAGSNPPTMGTGGHPGRSQKETVAPTARTKAKARAKGNKGAAENSQQKLPNHRSLRRPRNGQPRSMIFP